MSLASPLLAVRDLSVRYPGSEKSPVTAVDRLSFAMAAGEVLGVLGESGCGKTSLALSIVALLPPGGEITAGSVRFRGQELVGLGERRLRELRGAEIGLIFQEPALALHPMRRVGPQIGEVIRAHRPMKKGRCREMAHQLLEEVGLRVEDGIYHAYPHQLSGGQRQRIVIAQALACRPALVIADEPTASLDAGTETQILDLLALLKARHEMAVLYITHDPLVLAAIADRVVVLYAGRRVEDGPRDAVLREPLHPYTEGLLDCLVSAVDGERGSELSVLPGTAPIVREPRPGCPFAPRCSYRMEECDQRDPGAVTLRERRQVWCFRHGGRDDS